MASIIIYNGSVEIFPKKELGLKHLSKTRREFAVTLLSSVKHLQANATITLFNTAENKSTESMPKILSTYAQSTMHYFHMHA